MYPLDSAQRPLLTTPRLCLRAPRADDAPALVSILSDARISAATLTIPHPYTLDHAVQWLAKVEGLWTDWETTGSAVFGITLAGTGELIGAVGLNADGGSRAHGRMELGYWLSFAHAGRGYATEAARAAVEFAFAPRARRGLELHKLTAGVFTWNAASAAVLRKLGFVAEGRLREHHLKNGVWVDTDRFALFAPSGAVSG